MNQTSEVTIINWILGETVNLITIENKFISIASELLSETSIIHNNRNRKFNHI